MADTLLLPPYRRRTICWRCLLLSYAFLALFWAASTQVKQMNAPWLGVSTLALSLPMMLALWHQGTVRRLIALHQFQPGRALYRWRSRRALSIVLRALLAIALTLTTLLQSVFFSPVEWALLGLAPGIYHAARTAIEARSWAQFSDRVYAERWSIWATQCLVILILTAVSVGARYLSAEVPTKTYLDLVYEWQSRWAQVPSGTVKWALDAGAWGQVSTEALGHLTEDPIWRLLLALVVAPVSVFSHLALSLTGLSLPAAEVRRTLAERLTSQESPPPLGAARSAVWAAVATIGVMLVFQLLAAADNHMRTQDSPFAIKPLPECERIAGKVYQLNTSRVLQSLMDEVKGSLGNYQGAACEKLSEIEKHAEKGVDAYLDWYFSLGAEWSRLVTMLTGDIALLLQAKFNELVLSSPDVVQLLAGVQSDYEQQWDQLINARSRALELLEMNRLVVSDRGCKVVNELGVNPWTVQLDTYKTRLVTGAGAGLVAGAFAAKVAAKAMSKASMQAASKVLAKATTKKAASKLAGAAIGASIGSVIPGVGTAVGAAIGTVVGFAIGTGVDIAVLAAEEKLTRADMKKDLLSAVAESLRPYRDNFECK